MRQGFSGTQAAEVVGISYRQLDYWARTELVTPSIQSAAGSGSQRLYSFTDMLVLKIVKRLLDAGVSLQNIRTAVDHLSSRGIADLSSITLMSDGASIYECTSPEDVIDLVLEKKETAIHITTSLLKFLVSDQPNQEMISACSEIYFSSNYSMVALLHAVFSHEAFSNPKNKHNKIKTPVELLVSFQRQTGLRTVGLKTSYFFLRYTGQELFNPPNAAGWPGGKDWFSGDRLFHRLYLPGTLMEIANRKFAKKSLSYKLQSRISLPNKRQYRYYADAIWSEDLFYELLNNNNLSVSEWIFGTNSKEKNLSMAIQNLTFQYI